MSLFKAAITNTVSKTFGKFASYKFPSFLQYIINISYVKLMGVDLSNFDSVEHYHSLNELFTRNLLYKREISKDPKVIISPADSFISEMGDIKDDLALQIKGFSYKVSELLTSNFSANNIEKVKKGKFINFYLSPKDYHHYHAPMDMIVKRVVHVPGLLYPVNFTFLNRVNKLFVKNERVILECYDNSGKLFYMVLVGALNVGKMTLSFDKRVETNSDASKIQVYDYDDLNIKKGDEIGMFKMGSTVILIFEDDFLDFTITSNQKIRFSQEIGRKR